MPYRIYPVARRAGVLAFCVAFGAGAARADDSGVPPTWSFSGFGTLGVAHSSERHADYTSSVLKSTGIGYTRRWSADIDSRLGGQADLRLDRRWSAVLQVVLEQDANSSYQPAVEWANLKYQLTPDLALRAGRIALPMFLAADYRKVGYAYPWARPPVELYGSVPFANSDGVDLSYRWHIGMLRNVTQVFYGSTQRPVFAPYSLRVHRLTGLSHSVEYGPASVRISIGSARMDLDVGRELFDVFRLSGPAGAALAERYVIADKRVSEFGIGLAYDPGNWFAIGEYSRLRAPTYLGRTTQLYASAGYRRAGLTPYLSFALAQADSGNTDPGLALDGLAAPLAGAGAVLNAGLNALLATIPVRHSVSAGMRWDFQPDLALKLQYDRVTPHAGSRGTMIRAKPGFRSGHTAHVASAVLDFVF